MSTYFQGLQQPFSHTFQTKKWCVNCHHTFQPYSDRYTLQTDEESVNILSILTREVWTYFPNSKSKCQHTFQGDEWCSMIVSGKKDVYCILTCKTMKINPKRAIIATQIITAVDVIILNWLINSILSGNISSGACNRRSFLSLLRLLLSFPWSLQPSEKRNTVKIRKWEFRLEIKSKSSDLTSNVRWSTIHTTFSYWTVTLSPTDYFSLTYTIITKRIILMTLMAPILIPIISFRTLCLTITIRQMPFWWTCDTLIRPRSTASCTT